MPLQCCLGAKMQCTFGAMPAPLAVLPVNRVLTQNVPDANIMDHIPIVNIPSFGPCSSPAFPATAAATAAAMGVLTPMPCIPTTPFPWATGAPTVLLANFPTLDNMSKLACVWGGVISFIDAGEATVMVP